MIALRTPAKYLARQLGYDVHRLIPDDLVCSQQYPIATILDVGANYGQFAKRIRGLHPNAWIHSFEPLTKPFEQLQREFASDSRFVAHKVVVGETHGTTSFQQNGHTVFSSVLPMTAECRTAFPSADDFAAVELPLTTLDCWADHWCPKGPLLIKVDVQGYEDRVLRGSQITLQRAALVLVEVSFAVLYEGQCLFDTVHSLLNSNGFRLIGMMNNMFHHSTRSILQCDALFENTRSVNEWDSNA